MIAHVAPAAQMGFYLFAQVMAAAQRHAVFHHIVIRSGGKTAGADGQVVELGLGNADQRHLAVGAGDVQKAVKGLYDVVLLAWP